MTRPRVLVLGGGGFYGRHLVDDLIQFTSAELIVASRRPHLLSDYPDRVRWTRCDITELPNLQRLADGCELIVHCAGPFHDVQLNPLVAAMRSHANYIDISEDRRYIKGIRAREEEILRSGIVVLTGLSVVPAMEALAAEMLRPSFESLDSIRSFAAPDTRRHRGSAMFRTMLRGVGRPFMQPADGSLRKVHGWTEPEWVQLPPPIGKRLTYLVLEMADLDLLPELFGVRTVEFKAGTEWPILNKMLGLAAAIRKHTGHPDWERITPIVRALSWLLGRIGRDEGAACFELRGPANGSVATYELAVSARRDGGAIPSVLAGIAAGRLLEGSLTETGILPVHAWIRPEEFVGELKRRGLETWWKTPEVKEWHPFDYAEYKERPNNSLEPTLTAREKL